MASVSLWSTGLFWAGGKVTDYGSTIWRYSTPTEDDTIIWGSGPNEVDGKMFPDRNPGALEGKFKFPGPAAKILGGMFYSDKGPNGTISVTTGRGKSSIVAGSIWGSNYECNYMVDITITPGGGPGRLSHDCSASADDPIAIKRGNIDDKNSGYVNFYLPFKMSDLMHSAGGSGGLCMDYETVNEKVNLLSLESGRSNITAKGDAPDFLKVYLLDNLFENPMALGKPAYDLPTLRDILAASMKSGIQTNSIQLGVLLENIKLPVKDMDDKGTVGQFHVIGKVKESAESESEKIEQQTKL